MIYYILLGQYAVSAYNKLLPEVRINAITESYVFKIIKFDSRKQTPIDLLDECRGWGCNYAKITESDYLDLKAYQDSLIHNTQNILQ